MSEEVPLYLTDAFAMAGISSPADVKRRGFESPNYTQVPNDLFAIMSQMEDTELRVTLAITRLTIGYHRDQAKFSIAKLATMTGLSREGALTGAKAAELRGTLRRTNPDEITSAEWEMVVTPPTIRGVEDQPLQPLEGTPPIIGGQVGLNKDINKDINKTERFLKNASPEWGIMLNKSSEEIAQMAEKENHARETASLYEKEMGYNPLPWGEKKLSALLKFLLTKSPAEIHAFASWSKEKYSSLQPSKARQYPNMVIECWPNAVPDVPDKPPKSIYKHFTSQDLIDMEKGEQKHDRK